MSSDLILSERIITIYNFYQKRMGSAAHRYCRRGPNESRDKNSSSIKCERHFRRADDRVEVRMRNYP